MGRSTVLADQPPAPTAAPKRVSLESDPRWQVARRIAASRGFIKSRFLTGFILFICEKQLLDQTDVLTEQQIGEQVFQRPQGYNPGDDNIVRNYARLLRQRLEEYFAGEGADETIRIIVPRGGYVPLFVEEGIVVGGNKTAVSVEDPEYLTPALSPNDPGLVLPPPATVVRSSWALKGLCATLAAALLFFLLRDSHIFRPPPTVADRFWSVFFSSTRDTLVVPADSGLAMYQSLTRKHVHLADYVGGEYRKNTVPEPGISPAIVNELGSRHYTSVVDLHLVLALSQLPQVNRNRFHVRYARVVTLDDLKQSNLILSGSLDANPWVELFQKEMNFQFEPPQKEGGDVVIHNLHPQPGEKSFYETNQAAPGRTTYGVIASMPNLDGTGHVLLIEGINMAGTEAAADYLLSSQSAPLLNHVFDAKGSLLSFEVLLETSNIGANAPHPQIIAQRIGRR